MVRFCGMILAAVLLAIFTGGTLSNDIVKEIDMFKEVGLLDSSPPQGVFLTQGHHSSSRAFRFTTSTKVLNASQNGYHKANKLIHDSHDFWISAWAKIDKNGPDDNTVVSISSKSQSELYFKLSLSGESSGRGLNVEVTVKDKRKSFEYEVSAGRYFDYTKWFKVAVRLQDMESVIRIYVDDMAKPLKVDLLPGIAPFPADAELLLAQVYQVYQEGQGSVGKRFKGDLQDVKFIKGSGDDANLATCKCSDALAENNCVLDGLKYKDRVRWNKDNCSICQCQSGQVICTYTCQVCKDDGQTYIHGESWKQANNSCNTCHCNNGKAICSPPVCRTPDCTGKSGKVIMPPGQCCEVCREDHCLAMGKVYKACGCDKTCDNFKSQGPCSQCKEDCFCPYGKVMKNGKCQPNAVCPCTHKGKTYTSGQYVIDGCQYYFCANGQMTRPINIC